MNLGEKILEMFIDLPLTNKEKTLFINRKKELNKMENSGRFMHSSIYGIAGETGSGKTTLFNILKFSDKNIEKITIPISEKETKEVIIADLVYKLCEKVLQNKKFSDFHKYAKKTLDFLEQEETKVKEKGIKIGQIIEGESKWALQAKARHDLSSIKNRLKKIINSLTSVNKIVLCIDEIDKEQEKDVIIILDSLKHILRYENLLSFIALPQIMYQQYIEDRSLFFSEGNLENILKDVIPLVTLSDRDIEMMLDKRTQKFPEVLPKDVKELVIDFADGNPREALLVCQNALLNKTIAKNYNKEDFTLTIDEIKDEMEKFIEKWIYYLKLSSRENQILKIIYDESVLSKAEIIILVLEKSKIPKSTLRETIERLIEKKALVETSKDLYKVHRKIKLNYKYF
jgi:ABC-type lipoprotein export system ATPase subunit